VAAAGGLAVDHSQWIPLRHAFFLPVKVLSRVFRGKFVAGLKTAFHQDKLAFYGHLAPLAEPRTFAAWLRSLFRHDWGVYAKPPFGAPEHALRYLSGYTHRVAISNRRLVASNKATSRHRDRCKYLGTRGAATDSLDGSYMNLAAADADVKGVDNAFIFPYGLYGVNIEGATSGYGGTGYNDDYNQADWSASMVAALAGNLWKLRAGGSERDVPPVDKLRKTPRKKRTAQAVRDALSWAARGWGLFK
jgi:hypothetical protein